MDKLLLKLVALFKNVFNKQGIDYERMITIVQTKLTMDKRRVYMNWKQKQQKKDSSNHLKGVLFFYAFMGLFAGSMLYFVPSVLLSLILLHSYVLFMMSMTLITDFSSVLLDTTDNQVILSKPVSSKTLFMARLIHILVYLLQFTIAMALIPLLIGFIKYGILGGMMLTCTLLLTVLFAVFITYLLYLLIIRFSSESKVKDIVTYFQIAMTILFTLGFQVLPRIINLQELSYNFELHWYSYILPPVWMALAVEAFTNLQFDALHIAMIALAFVVLLFTFWAMNKYLAPSFAKKLAAMTNADTEKRDATKVIIQQEKKPLSKIFSQWVCASLVEKSGFEITWKMTGRDKSFKLQFYPGMAYIVIFIFIFVFKSGKDMASLWNDLPNTSSFLWFFYIPMMTVSSSIILVGFNENYQASWVYHSLPINKPGHLIVGMIKALFIKFFLPLFTIITIFCLFIWKIDVLDDALFALLNNLFCFLIFATLSEHYLPFSRQPNTQQQTGKFLKVIVQIFIVAITVGLHYLLIRTHLAWIMWVLTTVLGVACWLLLRQLQNLQWYKIAI